MNQAFERSNNIQWKNTDNENYTTYEYWQFWQQKVVLVGGANANDREEETSSADGTSCGEEVVEGDSCWRNRRN